MAVAILGLALPVLYTAISGALNLGQKQATRLDDAYLANSLLDRAGLEFPLEASELEGEENGRPWRLSISLLSPAEDIGNRKNIDSVLFLISASVTPRKGESGRPVLVRRLKYRDGVSR